ncbi:alpha/beta hydrolase [Streptomyces sp. CB01881]|uniref:alpha/beta hydrolase family protein n=1 Tax=Streptomyces sp. CB01881 TaxID=2078691 RepID=UPI000CDC1A6D|nr:alpha/beta hydrolase [Streptomyces sp. CB01881]AUY48133.1 alpha/beta hydrolase [Streptomyces sp. CB01881]TYC76619.1 alpha/beta hydrolase [Streptomyces sp. CB01881]
MSRTPRHHTAVTRVVTGVASRSAPLTVLFALLCLVAPQAAVATPGPATAGLSPPQVAEAPQVPTPTVRRPVGTASLHLVDAGRRDPWRADAATRELMATLWYPALSGRGERAPYMSAELSTVLFGGPEPSRVRTGSLVGVPPVPGPHPLIVLSPGFGLSRTSLTALAEDLAARGYAVAALDHTYETAVQFPDGRVERCLICDRVDDRRAAEVTLSRAKDIRFLIDRLTAGPGAGPGAEPGAGPVRGFRIDRSRIGVAGHSLGGASAIEAMHEDGRIRAAANLDGDFFVPPPDDGLARPVLLLGAQRGGDSPSTADWERTWKHLTGWKRWLDLPEGGHMTFCDLHWLVDAFGVRDQVPPDVAREQYGTIKGARGLVATRAYLGAFFDRHLLGRPGQLLDRPSAAYPEVSLVNLTRP